MSRFIRAANMLIFFIDRNRHTDYKWQLILKLSLAVDMLAEYVKIFYTATLIMSFFLPNVCTIVFYHIKIIEILTYICFAFRRSWCIIYYWLIRFNSVSSFITGRAASFLAWWLGYPVPFSFAWFCTAVVVVAWT